MLSESGGSGSTGGTIVGSDADGSDTFSGGSDGGFGRSTLNEIGGSGSTGGTIVGNDADGSDTFNDGSAGGFGRSTLNEIAGSGKTGGTIVGSASDGNLHPLTAPPSQNSKALCQQAMARTTVESEAADRWDPLPLRVCAR